MKTSDIDETINTNKQISTSTLRQQAYFFFKNDDRLTLVNVTALEATVTAFGVQRFGLCLSVLVLSHSKSINGACPVFLALLLSVCA